MRDLAALPKGHLHLHLEASVRPATLAELAQERGISVPAFTYQREDYPDFADFSVAYQSLVPVLDDQAALTRLVDEAVEDAAREGVVYLELSTSPMPRYSDMFGSVQEALATLTELITAAGVRHGVEANFMPSGMRIADPAGTTELARAAVPFAGKGIVSFGLAADERGFPPELFEEAFTIARDAGLDATPHAGELVGPESVWGAIKTLGASRIQHGVRSVEDPALIDYLAEHGIPLDVCPTSNYLLSVVDSVEEHPLPYLLEAGVRCSINADDPILFGPGVLEEYVLARGALGLTDEQLAACAWTSIETTQASDATKTKAKADIDAWLAAV